MRTLVHLHASHGECGTECGIRDCAGVQVAFRALDPERVTCPTCLADPAASRRRYLIGA